MYDARGSEIELNENDYNQFIDVIASILKIPNSISEHAKGVFEISRNQIHNSNLYCLAVASIYYAAKTSSLCPATSLSIWVNNLSEVKFKWKGDCYAWGFDFNDIISYNRKTIMRLERRIFRLFQDKPLLCSYKPSNFIKLIVDTLKRLNDSEKAKLTLESERIIGLVRKYRLHLGRDPRIIAASAIWLAGLRLFSRYSQKRPTYFDVSEPIAVTDCSIRNNVSRIRFYLRKKGDFSTHDR